MNRRNFIRSAGALVGLVAVEPVRRVFDMGANVRTSKLATYGWHDIVLTIGGKDYRIAPGDSMDVDVNQDGSLAMRGESVQRHPLYSAANRFERRGDGIVSRPVYNVEASADAVRAFTDERPNYSDNMSLFDHWQVNRARDALGMKS